MPRSDLSQVVLQTLREADREMLVTDVAAELRWAVPTVAKHLRSLLASNRVARLTRPSGTGHRSPYLYYALPEQDGDADISMPPASCSVDVILSYAPQDGAKLAEWFGRLPLSQLDRVWVAAVVECTVTDAMSVPQLAVCLSTVRKRIRADRSDLSSDVPSDDRALATEVTG